MKKLMFIFFSLMLSCYLIAVTHYMSMSPTFTLVINNPKNLPNLYTKSTPVNLKSKSLKPELLQYATLKNPYFVKEELEYFLELRDSTDRVIWHKQVTPPDSSSLIRFSQNPDAPLTTGFCTTQDGIVALADSTHSRYLIMDKLGNQTLLPKGTLGMFFEGKVANKYWLMNFGYMHWEDDQPLDDYQGTPKQTYFPFESGFALFNIDGSLYTQYDLSAFNKYPNQIESIQLNSSCDKFWMKWYYRDKSNDIKSIGQVMNLNGKLINMVNDLDPKRNAEWNKAGDLIYILSPEHVTIYDANSDEVFGSILAKSGSPTATRRVLALSDKKTGLAFLSLSGYLYVVNYIVGRALLIMPIKDTDKLELLRNDGTQFTITSGDYQTTYTIK